MAGDWLGALAPVHRACLSAQLGPTANAAAYRKEQIMSLSTLLLIVLILILVGALPSWPHSRSWGYFPSSLIGLIVVVLLILLLTGHI